MNPSKVATMGPLLVSEPDPQKLEKEGLVNGLEWECTLCLVCRCTSDWLLIRCVFSENANCTRAVFAFCFVLESCEHQTGKIRMLLRASVWFSRRFYCQWKVLQLLEFLTVHSAHFHPAPFTRPFFLEGLGRD